MQRVLLRSDAYKRYVALGDLGKQVFRSAGPLRETIGRENPKMVRHLAVPQLNDKGDVIEWYADFPGDIIPWAAAPPQERQTILSQLQEFQAWLIPLKQRFLQDSGSGLGSSALGGASPNDRKIFATFLDYVVRFPGTECIYLVDGTTVITFWGFLEKKDDLIRPALSALEVAGNAAPSPSAARTASVPPLEVPVATPRPWWRWLLWLLPLLLLLLLILFLLFGIRGCSPLEGTIPGLPTVTIPGSGPDEAKPDETGGEKPENDTRVLDNTGKTGLNVVTPGSTTVIPGTTVPVGTGTGTTALEGEGTLVQPGEGGAGLGSATDGTSTNPPLALIPAQMQRLTRPPIRTAPPETRGATRIMGPGPCPPILAAQHPPPTAHNKAPRKVRPPLSLGQTPRPLPLHPVFHRRFPFPPMQPMVRPRS